MLLVLLQLVPRLLVQVLAVMLLSSQALAVQTQSLELFLLPAKYALSWAQPLSSLTRC